MKYITLFTLLFVISANTQAEHKFLDPKKLFTSPTNDAGKLSPDGKYFSYVSKEKASPTLEFVDLNTMQVMTGVEMNTGLRLTNYYWLTSDVLYLQLRENDFINHYLLTVLAPSSTNKKVLSTKAQRFETGYIIDPLINEPAHVLFARLIENGDEIEQQLYRVRMDRLKAEQFLDSEYIETAPEQLQRYTYDSPTNTLIGIFFDEDEEEVTLKYKTLDSKQWRHLLSYQNEDLPVKPVGFINQQEIAVLTEQNAQRIGLYRYNINTQTIGDLLYEHPRYDLTDASLSANGELLSVEYVQGGLPRREWLNSYSKEIAKRFNISLDNGVPRIIDSSVENNQILVLEQGPNNPGKYYIYDSESDVLDELVEKFPELNDVEFPSHEVFKVTAPDGVEIEAYLTRPKGLDHNTLLVMPHGGPVGVRDYNFFSNSIQYLANRGFSVLRVNFRGSKGFGKAFKEGGKGQFGQQIEADISLVVDHVLGKQHYENVCAIGASYGAYSSFMLSMKHPEIYKCIIAQYGVYDLPLLYATSNYKSGAEHREKVAEVVGEDTAEKTELSPLYRADEVNVPVLLIAGKRDTVTGFEQSNRMRYVLESYNKDVQHLDYVRAGHGHNYWNDEIHENAYIAQFLLDKLDLPQTDTGELTKHNKEIMADEYALLADTLTNEKRVNEVPEMELAFLQKASRLGHGKATHNLGHKYFYGEIIEKDIDKALSLYKQAAELDYKYANARLGELYLGDASVARNDELALQYLTLAVEENASSYNKHLLARAYCEAGEAHKSIDKCKQLFEEQITKLSNPNERYDFYENFGLTVVNGNFTDSERADFTKFAITLLNVADPEFEVNIIDEGMWIYREHKRYARMGRYELVDDQTLDSFMQLADGKDTALGLDYRADVPGFGSFDEFSFSVFVFEEFDEFGSKVSTFTNTNLNGSRFIWTDKVSINDHKQGHSYKYTIYDIAGNIKHQRSFK